MKIKLSEIKPSLIRRMYDRKSILFGINMQDIPMQEQKFKASDLVF